MQKFLISLISLLCFSVPSYGQFVLKSCTINGGGSKLTATSFIHQGSVGQPAVGVITSNDYSAFIGFYGPYGPFVGLSDENNALPVLPKRYSLAQNSPNPFGFNTEIRFQIAANAVPCFLKIYDLQGRLIKTLVADQRSPGDYVVHWQGKDETGRSVASGIYFYRLQAGGYQSTKRMLLFK